MQHNSLYLLFSVCPLDGDNDEGRHLCVCVLSISVLCPLRDAACLKCKYVRLFFTLIQTVKKLKIIHLQAFNVSLPIYFFLTLSHNPRSPFKVLVIWAWPLLHITTLSPFTSDVSWIIRMTHSCTIWRSGYIISPDLCIKHRRAGCGGGYCRRIMGFWLHYTLRIWFQFGYTSTVIITALNSWQDWMTKLILD